MKVERLFYSIVIAVLAVLLLLEKCKRPNPCPPAKVPAVSTTIEVVDTMKEIKTFDTSYKPLPKKVFHNDPDGSESIYYPVSKLILDPPITWLSWHRDTAKNIYHSGKPVIQSEYEDTVLTPSGDTLIIRDTIQNNQIQGRGIDLKKMELTITTTRETVIIQKPRNQFFFAVNVYGNKTDFINGFSAGILLKTKREKYYEAGTFINRGLGLTGYVGTKIPIRLRK